MTNVQQLDIACGLLKQARAAWMKKLVSGALSSASKSRLGVASYTPPTRAAVSTPRPIRSRFVTKPVYEKDFPLTNIRREAPVARDVNQAHYQYRIPNSTRNSALSDQPVQFYRHETLAPGFELGGNYTPGARLVQHSYNPANTAAEAANIHTARLGTLRHEIGHDQTMGRNASTGNFINRFVNHRAGIHPKIFSSLNDGTYSKHYDTYLRNRGYYHMGGNNPHGRLDTLNKEISGQWRGTLHPRTNPGSAALVQSTIRKFKDTDIAAYKQSRRYFDNAYNPKTQRDLISRLMALKAHLSANYGFSDAVARTQI